jgi:hypothetical protein
MTTLLKVFGLLLGSAAIIITMGGCLAAILNSFHRKSGRLVVDEDTGRIVERRED